MCARTLWVSVLSPRAVVTANSLLSDIMTGVSPSRILLLSGRPLEDAEVAEEVFAGLCEVWLGSRPEVEVLRFDPLDPATWGALEERISEHGGEVLIDITPGRKLEALKLFEIGVRHGCALRYVYLIPEVEVGYRPFGLAPFDVIVPMDVRGWRRIDWRPPKLEGAPPQAKLGPEEFEAFVNLMILYAGAKELETRVGGIHGIGAHIEARLVAPGWVELEWEARQLGGGLLLQDLVSSALVEAGALLPSNFEEALAEIERYVKEGYLIIPDTNIFMDKITEHLEEALSARGVHRDIFRERIWLLRVVYNELAEFERLSDRGLREDLVRLRRKYIGFSETQRLEKEIPEPAEERFRDARGDSALLEEAKAMGRRVRAVLLTEDLGLAARARPQLVPLHLRQPQCRPPIKIRSWKLGRFLYYLVVLAAEVEMRANRYWARFSYSKEELIKRGLLRLHAPSELRALAERVKRTLELERKLLRRMPAA